MYRYLINLTKIDPLDKKNSSYIKEIKEEEEYKDEIGLVKELVKNNPNFENLSYENKINFVANMIVGLHNKREENKRKQR